ncbi:hypothetical protein IH982_03155 [Patescibacteria group bacterium]|nr:hypothetical protein [Patescibacteria group bacterium]
MRISRFQLIIIFIAVLVGIAGFWLWQKNSYSKEILKLEIIAPSEATMGEEITYVVKYKNNGNVRLQNPVLIFEYPAGAVPTTDQNTRITQSLDDIYPGQERNSSFSSRLFGKEGEIKEAKVLLQYTPRNLNAQFESETTATTLISHVPLTFELDLPSRMEAGQEFSFALNYFSNSEYPLSDLRITIEYPEGFFFTKATPSPIGESEWNVGLLNKAEGGRISITGSLEGEVQEAKIFKATLGTWKEGKFTLLREAIKGIEITRTRILISQEVNGVADYVASPKDTLHYVISFKNVSEKTLENLFLVVSLEGRPFDLTSIKSDFGTFQLGDNSIIFESKKVSRLRFLGKGEEGKVEFWVNVKEEWETFSSQDKSFVARNRIILSDVTEEFELKVNSKLEIGQAAYFQDEVFGNQGPLPPQVGVPTTYTVVWQVKNLYNDVQNAKVRAVLPLGISLTGSVFKEGESLTFDQVSREVVWEVGDLSAGTGPFETAPSVAFQIRLTPSESQQGNVVQLIGEANIQADDLFTEQSLSAADSPINTTLPDDDSVTAQMGVIQ